MEHIIKSYKSLQRLSKIYFVFGSIASLIGLLLFVFEQDPMVDGISLPFLLIGIIQMGGAFRDYFSVDDRLRMFAKEKKIPEAELYDREIEYARSITKRSRESRRAKNGLFFFGFGWCLLGTLGRWGAYSIGTGLGLSLQSAFLLIFNLLKEYQLGLFIQEAQNRRRSK